MSILQACVLGIIQGVTEFLPISSTAHLTIIPKLLGFEYQGRTVDVFLNIGTLCAIVLFFRKDVGNLCWGLYDFLRGGKTQNRARFVTLFLASLPVIIIGGVAELIFDFEIDSTNMLAINLILFGIILYIYDNSVEDKKDVTRKDAILSGLAQSVAIIPGISRLGATLTIMRLFKYDRWTAFKFSMILSLPPVAGACFLKMLKVVTGKITVDDPMVFLGMLFSFIFGLISLQCMKIFLKKYSFKPFAIYRILFGVCLL